MPGMYWCGVGWGHALHCVCRLLSAVGKCSRLRCYVTRRPWASFCALCDRTTKVSAALQHRSEPRRVLGGIRAKSRKIARHGAASHIPAHGRPTVFKPGVPCAHRPSHVAAGRRQPASLAAHVHATRPLERKAHVLGSCHRGERDARLQSRRVGGSPRPTPPPPTAPVVRVARRRWRPSGTAPRARCILAGAAGREAVA